MTLHPTAMPRPSGARRLGPSGPESRGSGLSGARDRRNKVRRSHLLLAGAVVVAGCAALLGNRSHTPAEVRGAPLLARAEPADPGARRDRIARDGAAVSAVATPAANLASLLDLDRRAIAADGTHFEAPLKDCRHAVLTLDPAVMRRVASSMETRCGT